MDYEQGLHMAQLMKQKDLEIRRAILKVQQAGYGVVALRFTDEGREMAIEILDEPYDDNVRVYPPS
jgi:diphthamide synthase subunit DPH2